MGFSNFRANVALRVLALLALCFVLVWGLLRAQWIATPLACAVLIVLLAVELVRYVERSNRDLASFLNFVAHQDFSTPIRVPQKGRVFDELQDAYRLLTGEYRRLNLQKEANHRYLEAVIEHVGVALFCFDEDGNVAMMNASARRLLGMPHVTSLHSCARIDPRLPELLQRLGAGERTLLRVPRGDEHLQLVLYATSFELLERRYKLVSFQNIRDELDQQEVESWQKLIRVLTHEIMNSVTPIISLSGVIRDTMVDEDGPEPVFRQLSAEERADLLRGMTAIQERSSGLLEFVQAYRSFATVPAPVRAEVDVGRLFERVRTLLSQEIERAGIRLVVDCPAQGLTVYADPNQVEQVLINLLRNAIDVLSGRAAPTIELRGSRDEQGRVIVQVSDNGPGIDPAHSDNIFVPFFSTKPGGMGVGLSISRQIMKANRGFISAHSPPEGGSTFTLKFGAGVP